MIQSAQEFVFLRNSSLSEEYIRASEEEAPIKVWYEIIQKFPDMKIWVVRNKKIQLEILKVLAKDEDWKVRAEVASKRKLDRDLFECLACDSDEAVRHRVAINPKCPLDVIKKLQRDKCEYVKNAAQMRM